MEQTPPTGTRLLRMEGVNLAAVLDDTNEVSVRRGAGLMLRQAALDVAKRFKQLAPISAGASVGLFEVAPNAPPDLVEQVAALLSQRYPHLTFVVDAVPLGADFQAALTAVTSANRVRQFRQPTLAVPAAGDGALCCAADQMRPAQRQLRGNTERYPDGLSPSVHARFEYGRQQRQRFYDEELGKPAERAFTDDLATLAEPAGGLRFGNLADKLALIYLDGNGFGEIQRRCQTGDALRGFDQAVRTLRREFLKALLAWIDRDTPAFWHGQQARLEVLLWGGDELMLVVPAWRGLATLQFFYEQSRDWAYRKTPLTHAGGLVFCHAKTPLAQVRRSAVALADGVKDWLKQTGTADGNRFDYLVLESIGYPTESLAQFRAVQYGQGVAAAWTPLAPLVSGPGARWADLAPSIAEQLARWPRGALREIAERWVALHQGRLDAQGFATRVQRLFDTTSDLRARDLDERLFRHLVPGVDTTTRPDHPGWLHLVELWDYLAPRGAMGAAP